MAYVRGPQTLARGPNLAHGVFSSGPHSRVNKNKFALISEIVNAAAHQDMLKLKFKLGFHIIVA